MDSDYQISFTNSALKPSFTVLQGTVDTNSTSLRIYGHAAPGYGTGLQENMLGLLENFCNSTPPQHPTTGQLWYNSNTHVLTVFDGVGWVAVSSTSGAGGYLHGLSDVSINTPIAGNSLVFDGSAWINQTIPTSGSTTQLDGLTDVTLTGPILANQVLTYNGAQWINNTLVIPSTLTTLTDVNIVTPVDAQILTYNSTTSQWENAAAPAYAGPTTITALTDVIIATPVANDILSYNGIKWVNTAITIPTTIDSLTDVVITSVQIQDTLTWDGTNWSNQPVALQLDEITDVVINTPVVNQVLTFDTNGTWSNQPIVLPYDIAFYVPTNPYLINTILSGYLSPRVISIEPLGVHIAKCSVPVAVDNTTFDIKQNGTTIASVTFTVGLNTGSISFVSATAITIVYGDVITLETGAVIDGSIAGIGITLVGSSSTL